MPTFSKTGGSDRAGGVPAIRKSILTPIPSCRRPRKLEGVIMKFPRRKFLHLAASAAALPAVPRIASAFDYPARPVRLLVGYTAGGTNDILARLIGQWLSARLGHPFVVENKPGASTNLATETVVRAPADGYTLLMVGPANVINASLYQDLSFNFIRDIAPIASVSREAVVMVVNPTFPAKTVPDLIAYAKANPGKINMASSGSGSSTHLAGELFQQMTGTTMVHVPYRGGGPAFTDLLGNRVQVFFPSLPVAMAYIKAGSVRALAVTSSTRVDGLPEVPTMSEFVPGYEASAVYGLGAPKDTPGAIIELLNGAINSGLADQELKSQFGAVGSTVFPGAPSDFAKLIADETEKWGKVVRTAGIKPE
jgi:tripartite-type tricarboxylate transporter receptor subunit TctC